MLLLNGHSLTPKRKVAAESINLRLRERDSTASITPTDMTGIETNSWFQDDTNPGKGIVWRVKSIQMAYATGTPTVQLEHVINSLRDKILFGVHKAAQITGNSKATKCTAEQALRYILSFSDDWVLGTCGYGDSKPYKFDGDTLYDAVEKVTNSLEDPWWSYDTTRYPFVLNVTSRPDGTASVLRPGRNLTTITRSVDRSGMFTRFYPIGKDDLHISGDYVSRNEGTYGVISKVDTDSSLETEAELRSWADSELRRHAEPTFTVTADAMELADATGESMDRMTLGRICMIPLTEYSTTIEERITELNYTDKIQKPESVRVTLCNNHNDVTKVIAEAIKKGGGGRRSSGRQSKEDHAWFEDTNDHVAMCAIGIIGTDANGKPNWTRLSRLEVNEEGIFGEVKSVQNDVEIASARIDVTENSINQVVKAVGSNGKVTAASICLAINKSGSSATISADHIVLTGSTKINDVMTINGGRVYITTPLRVAGDAMVGTLTVRGGGSGITLTDSDLATTIKRATVKNNILTLTPYRGEQITFSRAVASWSLGWGRGDVTVTANPQNQRVEIEIGKGTPVWDDRKVTIPILARNSVTSGIITWTDVTATAPDPVWSYSQYPSESNTMPTGYDRAYDLDSRAYTYHEITVTVDGVSKRILFRTNS